MPCKTTSTNLTLHILQSPSKPLTPLSPSSSERHNCLIKSAILNTCSISNKIPLILELAAEHDLDLIIITETWITLDDIPLIESLNTGPYSCSHLPSNTHNYGGGIGIIYKSSLYVFPLRDHNNDHSEAFICSISPHTPRFLIYYYFNDPSSSIPLFLSELYSFNVYILMSESNIIIGNFNIATNLSTNHSKSLLSILSSSNLKHHNTYPTHKHGNTLDLLISQKVSNLNCAHSFGPCISSHYLFYPPIP